MNRAKTITRRHFLKGATVALATPHFITSSALGANGRSAPSNRIGVGFIGAGIICNAFHLGIYLGMPDAQVVAICDVDAAKREATRKRVEQYYAKKLSKGAYKGCAAYNDFRDLIGQDDVDAVVVATPDHWHVLPAIAAAKAGKDIYVEKPQSLTISEGRALSDTVRRYGRCFQHGTQQRSSWNFRFAAELVRNGRIGELHTVKVGAPGGLQTGYHPPMPVPKGFDYDLWLGQAPWAPYTKARCHGTRNWIWISDYSGGYVTGWGIHHIDSAHWGMDTDLTGPVEIEGKGVYPKDGLWNTVLTWDVEIKYPNGVKMIFTDNRKCAQGVRFEGTEGWVYVRRGHLDAHPKSLLKSVTGPNEIHLYESRGHQRNFLDCIKTRAETVCPVELAHRSTTVCHLSNIAMLLERKLKWDREKERFINDPEANRMLSRAMRSPWRL